MTTSTIQLAGAEGLPTQSTAYESDSLEALRQILVKEQHREVAYEEAANIGVSLIEFFEVLAAS